MPFSTDIYMSPRASLEPRLVYLFVIPPIYYKGSCQVFREVLTLFFKYDIPQTRPFYLSLDRLYAVNCKKIRKGNTATTHSR